MLLPLWQGRKGWAECMWKGKVNSALMMFAACGGGGGGGGHVRVSESIAKVIIPAILMLTGSFEL